MTRCGHPRSRALAVACAIAAPLVLIAQSGRPAPAAQTGPAATAVTFTDVTAAAGITFRHSSGAFGRKYLPETMGSGVAFLDIDADGWQDVFFVNATRFPGRPDAASYPALYRNNGNGTFTDVTRAAGLFVEMYGMGAAAADYDNDGRTDLYVTALGANRLFRNAGGSRFVDVTTRAGVGDPGFSTSAAWLDYNRDGVLDLFVANYVEWSPQKDLFCTLDGTLKSYCTPESYQGHSSTLYRGKGDGTFEDVTRPAGIYDPNGKALGVALIDYDSDGWMDLFVAHDTQPNRLYRNLRNGRFTDVGLMAGVAFSEAGAARAGMGVDAADYDGSGRQGLIVGNFSNEMMALYANEGTGLFIDEAPASAVGKASLLTLTFGAFFFDYDLDGRIDIFAANGHVADDIGRVQPNVKYAAAAASLQKHRRREVRGRDRQRRGRLRTPDGGTGRRVRRLRRRWRSRRDRDHEQRPRAATPQRRREPQSMDSGRGRGHAVEQERHRNEGPGHRRGRAWSLGLRQDGIELLLAERAARHTRAGTGAAGVAAPDMAGRTGGDDWTA